MIQSFDKRNFLQRSWQCCLADSVHSLHGLDGKQTPRGDPKKQTPSTRSHSFSNHVVDARFDEHEQRRSICRALKFEQLAQYSTVSSQQLGGVEATLPAYVQLPLLFPLIAVQTARPPFEGTRETHGLNGIEGQDANPRYQAYLNLNLATLQMS